MGFSLVEDRPTPKDVYNFRMYLFAFIACFGAMMFGYDTAVIGSTIQLQSFKRDFGINQLSQSQMNNVSSNVVCVFQGGAFFGALFALPFTQHCGRRIPIAVTSALFIVGSFLQTWANGSLQMMYVGRTLTGIGVGTASSLVPMYISEFSPAAIRGRLIGIYDINYQFAALIGFWINYGTAEHISSASSAQWRIPLAVQVIPGGLLFLSMFLVWESPRWLAERERWEDCVATLSKIRQLPRDHAYIQGEVEDMRIQLKRETEINKGASFMSLFLELLSKGNRNRLGFGVGTMVFQSMSGINGVNYYSPTIFESLGVSGKNASFFATGIYGVVKFAVSTVFLVWILDRVGRRKPLLIGSIGAAAAMWYIGGYIAVAKPTADSTGRKSAGGWVAIACIYVFVIFYCASWNAIPWIISAEIFPTRVRALGVTITTATQWIMQFAVVKSTPYMISNIGFGTYFLFASFMTIAFLWVYFFLPETTAIRLEDMDALFKVGAVDIVGNDPKKTRRYGTPSDGHACVSIEAKRPYSTMLEPV